MNEKVGDLIDDSIENQDGEKWSVLKKNFDIDMMKAELQRLKNENQEIEHVK